MNTTATATKSGAVPGSFTSAGNHVHDSTQCATTKQDRLPLKTIRRFCIKTAHEIAEEQNGTFGGVERVAEESGQ